MQTTVRNAIQATSLVMLASLLLPACGASADGPGPVEIASTAGPVQVGTTQQTLTSTKGRAMWVAGACDAFAASGCMGTADPADCVSQLDSLFDVNACTSQFVRYTECTRRVQPDCAGSQFGYPGCDSFLIKLDDCLLAHPK